MQATRIGYVPDDYDSCCLKAIIIVNDSGVWGSEPLNDGDGVITLRSTNFTNDGVLNLGDVAKRVLTAEKNAEKSLMHGDILIERSGGSDTQAVGRVGFVSEEIEKNNVVFANFIQRIRLSKEVDAHYVFFLLQRLYELGITQSMQFQTTGIRNLDYKYYLRTVLPKPSKTEQQLIAEKLLLVNNAITLVQASISAAQKLKCALMQNLLIGKLRPDGTWRREDEFDIDPKFGRMPKGWSWRQMRTFGEIVTGRTPPPADESNYADTGHAFITPGDLGESRMIARTERYVTEAGLSRSNRIQAGAVCVVCIGSTIGKVGIAGELCCTNQQINSLMPNDDSDTDFLFFLLNSQQQRIRLWAGVNATPQLNKSDFGKYRVLAPKFKHEQSAIAYPMLAVDWAIEDKKAKIERLKKLKKALMQNLLTGKVRIPPDLKIE